MTLRRDACRGIWVPLPTPFAGDGGGRLDPEALVPIVEWLLARGVEGLLALGTTGEAAHCDEDEGAAVVRAAVRASAGRVPVFAGSGRASTRATIAATQSLAAVGADGVLVLTPHVYRGRMHGDTLVRHYAAVADASPVPVFAYHMPGVTGLDLDAGTLATIVQHPNVWGFKDSSTEGGPLAAVLVRARTIGFVGSGPRLVAGLDAGAAGGIVAVALALPEACTGLESAWRAGDRARAVALQEHLRALSEAWQGWAIPGAKYAARRRGLPAGAPRAPLEEPPADVRARIDAALDAALAVLAPEA